MSNHNNDLIKMDLSDSTREFIIDALTGFLEDAPRYGRKLVGIRMSREIFERLGVPYKNAFFHDVPITITDEYHAGFLEVRNAKIH